MEILNIGNYFQKLGYESKKRETGARWRHSGAVTGPAWVKAMGLYPEIFLSMPTETGGGWWQKSYWHACLSLS